jgi:hypothetical protein
MHELVPSLHAAYAPLVHIACDSRAAQLLTHELARWSQSCGLLASLHAACVLPMKLAHPTKELRNCRHLDSVVSPSVESLRSSVGLECWFAILLESAYDFVLASRGLPGPRG